MAKIGRNQPCPCGSGKKYKYCCGKENNIIPFPGPEFSASPQIVENLGEPILRVPPVANTPDLPELLNTNTQRYNDAPQDDFLGLSASQMYSILNLPFEENDHVLSFVPRVLWEDVKSIPFLEQALYFLTALEELQPLPTTKNGNLPRHFVQRIYENAVQKHLLYDDLYPHKEDDVPPISRLRYVLTFSGLVKKYKKAFSLTREASRLLKTRDWTGIYGRIFKGFSFKYSWGCDDRYPELWAVQHTLIFNLYMLKQKAANYVSGKKLGTFYAQAFPVAVDEAAESSTDPAEVVTRCFALRFLQRYAEPMGLIAPAAGSSKQERLFASRMRYKTTPLLTVSLSGRYSITPGLDTSQILVYRYGMRVSITGELIRHRV